MRRRPSIVDCLWQWFQLVHPPHGRVDPRQLAASLSLLEARCPAVLEMDEAMPIFVLATSWRSGSTLLQRLLATDESLLLWGEPLGRLGLLQQLAKALSGITESWPPTTYWCPPTLDGLDLARTWTANLYPEAEDLRRALRHFVLSWLGESSTSRGRSRWGFKEVRLGLAEAQLLAWLFPKAKFLVLVRHPCDAYRSVSRAFPLGQAWNMYARWPDIPLEGVVQFARHWHSLTTSWLNPGIPLAHRILRYEDLIAGRIDMADLEAFLDLRLDPDRALTQKIGSTHNDAPLHRWEKSLIHLVASPGMKALGYRADGTCDAAISGSPAKVLRRD